MVASVKEQNSIAPIIRGSTKQQSSKKKKNSSSPIKSSSSDSDHQDVRAMRHLRSIVESIAHDESLSQAERYQKISNFEELLELAKKRMQDDPSSSSSSSPVMEVASNIKGKKPKGWWKMRLLGKQRNRTTMGDGVSEMMENNDQRIHKSGTTEQQLETVHEEEQLESREDVDVQRYDDITGQNSTMVGSREPTAELERSTKRCGANDKKAGTPSVKIASRQAVVPSSEEVREGDSTVDTFVTDSIMGLRMQNSEDYVASVCSIRSLGTFERDFINNIIAEQVAANDQISVSTFEQDFMARQTKGESRMAHPTQVFIRSDYNMDQDAVVDDLTVGTIGPILSETTFEQDARSITEAPKGTFPVEVTAISGENDIFDDLSVGSFRSETAHDRQVRMRNNPHLETRVSAAPTTFAMFDTAIKGTKSNDSQVSVSTYEKDMVALNALAVKIGRTPSTKSNPTEVIIRTTASDRSCSTFEKDAAMRANNMMMMAKAMVRPPTNACTTTRMNFSELSTPAFEEDYNARLYSQERNPAAMSEAAAVAHSARWAHSFNRLGIQVTEKGQVILPKISPLAVELSPEAIAREVKLREREGTFWGRFSCFTGV